MYPQTQILKILSHLKRKYKRNFYYKMLYNEVEISMFEKSEMTSFVRKITTKTFTFDEVLKWHNNPDKYFKESWCKND